MNMESDSYSTSSHTAHLHQGEERNTQAGLTGGSLRSSEVAHSLMLDISAVSPHIKAPTINKR